MKIYISESDTRAMFAYDTEKENFLVATNGSLTIKYKGDGDRIKLLGVTLHTRTRDDAQGSDQHQFDANLDYIAGRNSITKDNVDSRFAMELFHEVLGEITEKDAQETKSYKRLTAEDAFLINTIQNVLTAQNLVARL